MKSRIQLTLLSMLAFMGSMSAIGASASNYSPTGESMTSTAVLADDITATTDKNHYCKSDNIQITYAADFTILGGVNPGNEYTFELSDSSGSFAAPVTLGTYTSTNLNDTRTFALPGGLTGGTNYRVRVVADDPALTGTPSAAFAILFVDFNVSNNCQGFATPVANLVASSFSGNNIVNSYAWDFGNGQNSNVSVPNFNINYATAGTFNISVTVQTKNGCTDFISKPVTIHPKPVSDFTINEASQCNVGHDFDFTNTSSVLTGSIVTNSWTFSDATNAATLNVNNKTFATIGSYTAQLLVTTDQGCTHATTKGVTVRPNPVADFTVSNNCQGLATNFTNNSTIASGSISEYTWTFGDGSTSNVSTGTFSKTYSNPGTFNIKVVVRGQSGCKDSTTRSVTIHPKPVSDFTINEASQCNVGHDFDFTNTSSVLTGSIVTNSWTFSDATNAATLNVNNKTFATIGSYTAQLLVTTDQGCTHATTKGVTVRPNPVADFTVNDNCFGITTPITNNSTIASGSISSYSWTFGDGSTSNVSTASFNKMYGAAGTYTIKVVLVGQSGCTDSTTRQVTIHETPTAAFLANDTAQCQTGNNFVFQNNSTIAVGTMTYLWEFGTQATSVFTNPQIVLNGLGSIPVKLTATSNLGCTNSSSLNVTLLPSPIADFAVSGLCENVNTTFTNKVSIPSGSISQYSWDFGDGNTSNVSTGTFNKVYGSAGTYSVKLVVRGQSGCKDSTTQQVVINPKPSASFTVNNNSQCEDVNNFVFTNSSTVSAGTLSYTWSFDNGSLSSTATNPQVTFPTPGGKNVILTATSNAGCIDTETSSVNVGASPVVDFTVNNNCEGLASNFTNNTTVGLGSISAYSWDFGDGNTSNVSTGTFSKTYAAAGTYTIQLTATAQSGCISVGTKQLTIFPTPVADYTVNNATQCEDVNSFVFTNASSIGSGSMSYSWSFDGGSSSSTSTNPTVSFNSAGSKAVELTVTSNNGCVDVKTSNVTVGASPIVDFTVNNNCEGLATNFTNSSSISAGSISSYAWNFGDGNTSNVSTASFSRTYAAPGTYTVTATLTGQSGCVSVGTKQVTIFPTPVADYTVNNATQCEDVNSFVFTNASSIGSGSMTYNWSFDGGSSSSTSTNPTVSFNSAGSKAVELTVTSNNGCVDVKTSNVTVGASPIVDFTVNNNCEGLATNFTNSSSISAGSISSYDWNFGDGNTSNVSTASFSKTYAAPGTYTVTATLTGQSGCVSVGTKQVTIFPTPVADYTVNNATQCEDVNNFVFTNNSSIAAGTMTYAWSFAGGSSSSTATNPSISFNTPGSKSVELTVTSNNGCVDVKTSSVTVGASPVVDFTVNNNCEGLATNFTNSSSGSISSYAWNFGDGNTSNVSTGTFSKTYAAPGTYTVTATLTGQSGCVSVGTKQVTIFPTPVADYTVNNATQCEDVNNFVFTNNSSIAAGTMTYAWSFAGGSSSSTATNPSISFNTPGSKSVELTVTSNNGCVDVITGGVTVVPSPTAAFTVNSANCEGVTTNFTNNSSISAGSISSYNWDFGDGSSSNVSTGAFAKTYAAPGTFTVKVIVTGQGGCKDSTTNQVTIHPTPVANFTVNNTSQCENGNSFVYTNSSTISGGTMTHNWDFGNSTSATIANPIMSYSNPGSYTVTLLLTSDKGCTDSRTSGVTVRPSPVAAFTVNTSNCQGIATSFVNNSTVSSGSMSSINWTFGNGAGTNAQGNFNYTYPAAGTYNIKLVVRAQSNCSDSLSQQITIHAKPVASFTAPNTCDENAVDFTNNSNVVGSTLAYNWRFGDGNTSNVQVPNYVYAGPGTYNVRLNVTSAFGCMDSVARNITIFAKPEASFTAPNTCVKANVPMVNTSTISAGSINSRTWHVGVPGTTFSSNNVNYAYANAGVYDVKLVVRSNNGCTDSAINSIEIFPNAVPDFVATTVCQGVATQFTNQTTGAVSVLYQFTSTATSNANNPSFTFPTAGTYNVKLSATTNNGCVDSVRRAVVVNALPNVNFTFSDVCDENVAQFNDQSNVAGGFIVARNWTMSDGGAYNSLNAQHTFPGPGAYDVKLVAYTNNFCSDSITKSINIWPNPVASFTATDVCNGFATDFTNLSTISAGSITANNWNLGNGQTSNVAAPSYIYPNAGTYSVTLEVVSDNNCRNSVTNNVVVYELPVAAFVTDRDTTNIVDNVINFENRSVGADSYNWSFGDANTSTDPNPSNAYMEIGTYRVVLLATTNNGCVDSVGRNVVIIPNFSLFMPNSFTPNSDNLNEVFRPVGVLDYIGIYRLQIWDKNGNVVYNGTNPAEGWNGKLNNTGNDCLEGEYIYRVFFYDHTNKLQNLDGVINLYR